jgi:hypothetical protein
MWSTIGVYLCVDGYYDASSFLSRLNNDTHTPLRATSPQTAMHIPKAFMVNTIKSHLIKLLGTPFPGVNERIC